MEAYAVRDCADARASLAQAEIFVGAGVNKIRLTGGEPLLRKDIAQLTRRLHELPGKPAIGITTNAIGLKRRLAELQANGAQPLSLVLLMHALQQHTAHVAHLLICGNAKSDAQLPCSRCCTAHSRCAGAMPQVFPDKHQVLRLQPIF